MATGLIRDNTIFVLNSNKTLDGHTITLYLIISESQGVRAMAEKNLFYNERDNSSSSNNNNTYNIIINNNNNITTYASTKAVTHSN